MNPPIKIAPSLLACDFLRLGEEVRRVEDAGADWLHVDVMDGCFVPNLSIGLPVVAALKTVANRPLDVHIMIADPERYARRYVEAGAETLSFHAEACFEPARVVDEVVAAGGRPGIAVNPDTDLTKVSPVLSRLSLVLVMTVFPGFGGQSFIPEALHKVRELREMGYEGDIEVDGGIGPSTIAEAARAGANVFVAGTAIFGAPDLTKRIAELRDAAQAVVAA